MKKDKIIKEIVEWLSVILSALVFALFINYCVIVNARVPSSSMETTIMTGDRVIGLRFAYIFDEPKRGDIVIFKYPDDEKVLYIKRIIGMPGDTVDVKDGKVFINDEVLDEPYLRVITEGKYGPYKVPEGSYFMMGDNRNRSADSRFWDNTFLKKEGIVGKAWLRYYPSIDVIQ